MPSHCFQGEPSISISRRYRPLAAGARGLPPRFPSAPALPVPSPAPARAAAGQQARTSLQNESPRRHDLALQAGLLPRNRGMREAVLSDFPASIRSSYPPGGRPQSIGEGRSSGPAPLRTAMVPAGWPSAQRLARAASDGGLARAFPASDRLAWPYEQGEPGGECSARRAPRVRSSARGRANRPPPGMRIAHAVRCAVKRLEPSPLARCLKSGWLLRCDRHSP